MTVFPRDRFGNVLFVDPVTASGFGVTATGATATPLTSGLDGSYTSTVTYDPAKPPTIGATYNGVPVVVSLSVPYPGPRRAGHRGAHPVAGLGIVSAAPIAVLADGTYLAQLHPRRTADGPPITVRVIEYTVHSSAPDGGSDGEEDTPRRCSRWSPTCSTSRPTRRWIWRAPTRCAGAARR